LETFFDKAAACARLNLRVLTLALRDKWLSSRTVAESYDCVAPFYDETWLPHLRGVTDALLSRVPEPGAGAILDLGCGTGYAAQMLCSACPGREIIAVDVSAGMLARARERLAAEKVSFVQADMLDFLSARPSASASLIVSAWAMGYSNPGQLIRQAARVLAPGGALAFVVNTADTLAPVFKAYRNCMARFPEKVRLAAWPRFPESWATLRAIMLRSGFEIEWYEDGFKEVPRPSGQAGILSWLLKTGVLAGFDAMLPLREGGPEADYFERLLKDDRDPIRHHYVAAAAKRA